MGTGHLDHGNGKGFFPELFIVEEHDLHPADPAGIGGIMGGDQTDKFTFAGDDEVAGFSTEFVVGTSGVPDEHLSFTGNHGERTATVKQGAFPAERAALEEIKSIQTALFEGGEFQDRKSFAIFAGIIEGGGTVLRSEDQHGGGDAELGGVGAAFDYPAKDRKPLPVLKLSALKKRGLDGLYLFKCQSLGRDSTLLDGRCSLSMVPGEASMFIRNAGRANNELRAEPGDFVISREGEFVGLIIARDTADSGRVHGVKVMLFEDDKLWDKAVPVSVLKKPGSEYFDLFGKKMAEIRRSIPADSRRR